MRTKGFTLLELIIVIAIIAVIMRMVSSMMVQKPKPLENFLGGMNALMHVAKTQAVLTHTPQRIYLDFDGRYARVDSEVGKKTTGEGEFAPVQVAYLPTRMDFMPQIVIEKLFINGKEELSGSRKPQSWFYINAQGIAQQISMVIGLSDSPQKKTLVLNPLSGLFKEPNEAAA
ncbi:MAG: hypothetical protein UU47_C0004G0048 [candidate division TM6 bacterium GW2011_GWE2_41_16]|nr:MAG: hypothetical protein UU47_C0004G0048 [candidate division TM6 bacterium GW2011_GWE2_41_16]